MMFLNPPSGVPSEGQVCVCTLAMTEPGSERHELHTESCDKWWESEDSHEDSVGHSEECSGQDDDEERHVDGQAPDVVRHTSYQRRSTMTVPAEELDTSGDDHEGHTDGQEADVVGGAENAEEGISGQALAEDGEEDVKGDQGRQQ